MKKNETLKQLRAQAVNDIKVIMGRHNTDNLQIQTSDTPVLCADVNDDNFTYTLDGIRVSDNKLVFLGSNCCDSSEWPQNIVGTDDLIFIAEWLEDNEEEIWEENEQEEQ